MGHLARHGLPSLGDIFLTIILRGGLTVRPVPLFLF
nr:MAG TPA: hypothetical protein [Caudoviricetes sp.]